MSDEVWVACHEVQHAVTALVNVPWADWAEVVLALLMVTASRTIARLHKVSLGLPRALNNAAVAALIAAATAGKALVDDDCAKKAVAELTRD